MCVHFSQYLALVIIFLEFKTEYRELSSVNKKHQYNTTIKLPDPSSPCSLSPIGYISKPKNQLFLKRLFFKLYKEF